MAETLSEQVARLERELAELRDGAAEEMRQRDTYRDMWRAAERLADEGAKEVERLQGLLAAAESRLADAERRGRIEGFVDGAGWLHGEAYRLGLYRENVAVPEPGSVVRVMGHSARDEARRRYPAVPPEREGATEADRCACGHLRGQHVYGEGPCRPGFVCADKCEEFRRPTPPQAAPEPEKRILVGDPDDVGRVIVLTQRDCQRIVETARRASGREDA